MSCSASHAPSASVRGVARLLGTSPAIERVARWLHRLGACDVPVLLQGETGTGKELAARALHEESGRPGPFVAVSLPELAEGVFESELFGHARGAFTGAVHSRTGLFERAAGGTLFLDEVGDAPLPAQAKLLRALEAREIRRVGDSSPRSVDVRIVSATHRELPARVRSGDFRADLFYRLRGAVVRLPPLRERPEDVETLALAFLGELAARTGRPQPLPGPGFLAALARRAWPGNVRELRCVLENAMLWWDGKGALGWPHLAEALLALDPELAPQDHALAHAMVEAWRRHRGNQEAARRELGLTRAQWRSRFARLGPPGRAGRG